MKKTIITLILIGIAIYGLGCCGAVDKAKEMAEEVEGTVETAARLSEEMEKLKNEDGEFELTQSRIDKFIREFPIFEKAMKEKSDEVEKTEDEFQKGMKSLSEISNIDEDLRSAGIENTAEFYLTMTEVSAAMFYLAFKSAMEEARTEMDKQVAEMEKQLEDPNIPEEQKEVIRQTIEGLKESDTTDSEIPDALNEKEIELVRKNFDKLADVLGMDVVLEEESEEEISTEEAEETENDEETEAETDKPEPKTGGKQKGARVQ